MTKCEVIEKQYKELDSRFVFVNTGFNFRPMSIKAAMAYVQLRKLKQFNEGRKESYKKLYETLNIDKRWSDTNADYAMSKRMMEIQIGK